MKLKYILPILLILCSLNIVVAPDPYLHMGSIDAFCEVTKNTEAQWCCQNARNLMYAGAMVPDSMIKDYFTMSGENYRLMHDWSNTEGMILRTPSNDKEGICYSKSRIFHQIPDAISHNYVVPQAMSNFLWGLPIIGGAPNEIIHIPVEYGMGVSFLEHQEEAGISKEFWFSTGEKSIDVLLEENNARLIDREQSQLGASGKVVDVRDRINGLLYFVGSNRFFEEGYTPASDSNVGTRRLDIMMLGISLVLLIPGILLTISGINGKKWKLIFSTPLILIGSLLLLFVLLALVNNTSVVAYIWKFLYQTLGGFYKKDETFLIGATLEVADEIWANPATRPQQIVYRGQTININEPHGFNALGYGSGGTSFTRLIMWIVKWVVIIAVIPAIIIVVKKTKKKRR